MGPRTGGVGGGFGLDASLNVGGREEPRGNGRLRLYHRRWRRLWTAASGRTRLIWPGQHCSRPSPGITSSLDARCGLTRARAASFSGIKGPGQLSGATARRVRTRWAKARDFGGEIPAKTEATRGKTDSRTRRRPASPPGPRPTSSRRAGAARGHGARLPSTGHARGARIDEAARRPGSTI